MVVQFFFTIQEERVFPSNERLDMKGELELFGGFENTKILLPVPPGGGFELANGSRLRSVCQVFAKPVACKVLWIPWAVYGSPCSQAFRK